ncbi:hypothetical protein OG369_43360 [Streptomyces sp. NBC_01221]|uniref:hypothetical protein n=1 Tax=Streptomyces sp. NBC_01221 TaxID=2903782 RepID=UPI002252BCBF|nr:hypothetical protein [Streptomyces sp. NBC_01221]MCX4792617.1 hypothetical protein [Streptomyces sp. NBC_01221]
MSPSVIVDHIGADGGRRVSVRSGGRTHILGIAYSDVDVIEFLRRAGLDDPGPLLDDPSLVEWRGGRPHEWAAA